MLVGKRKGISIHALRGEGDEYSIWHRFEGVISIHALRGEGDWKKPWMVLEVDTISIHALRGEGDRLRVFYMA